METVLHFIHTGGQIFGPTAVSVLQNFGKGEANGHATFRSGRFRLVNF